MTPLLWAALAVMAFAATALTITTPSNQRAIMFGLMGVFAWLLTAYMSLNVETITSSGTIVTQRYPALAAFCLMMAAPNAYIALTGPLEIVRDRDELRGEVT